MRSIKIADMPTRAPEEMDKKETKEKMLPELTKQIGEEAKKLYAGKEYSILVILQGMDSSGKDGVSRNVFSRVSPTMVNAYSFKRPTDREFAHDFLWRVHNHAPSRGEIKLFVRSHYEDILIQRVHGWIDEKRVHIRMEAINEFEELLARDNNTIIMKFFLHLSKDRQREKLIERIERVDKNYKHNDGDWEERKYWDEYMKAYEYVLNHSVFPWEVVASDQRWYRNYFVARQLLKRLQTLNLEYPELKIKPEIQKLDAKG